MTWLYVINLEEAGCAGCGHNLREGREVFQRTDPITDEKTTLCLCCAADYLTHLVRKLRIQDTKAELRMMRDEAHR